MATEVTTNIRIQSPSRKRLVAGDVFSVSLPDSKFLFGRVVDPAISLGGIPAILIYLYRRVSRQKEIPRLEDRQASNLMVSPIATNRLVWSRGYFETIGNVPLGAGEVLSQHCFLDSRGCYFDEHGNRLDGPIEPVGDYGLHSFRTIDDQISDALGIERAPDS